MCWEIDYLFLAEQKKAQQARAEQEQRDGVIKALLDEANTSRRHHQDRSTRGRRSCTCEIAALASRKEQPRNTSSCVRLQLLRPWLRSRRRRDE